LIYNKYIKYILIYIYIYIDIYLYSGNAQHVSLTVENNYRINL